MMEKISQRTQDDCAICAVSMVMGPPYTYERVLQDSKKYSKTNSEGGFRAWWKDYLDDEGFEAEHRPLLDCKSFSDLASLPVDSRAMFVWHCQVEANLYDFQGALDQCQDGKSTS